MEEKERINSMADYTMPKFKDIYQNLLSAEKHQVSDNVDEPKTLTLSVNQMPLREFLLDINNRTGVSIICDMNLDDKPVTLDVVNMEIGDILSAVARRCGADVIVQNNLYYMGSLQAEDRGFLVRKVRRLNADDIEKVLSSLISDQGRVFASGDGLIVVGDRVRLLQRINSMLDELERQPANTWIVQMYLIANTTKGEREFGLDTSINAGISHTSSRERGRSSNSTSDRTRTTKGNSSLESIDNDPSSRSRLNSIVDDISNLDISAAFANSASKLVSDTEFRAVLKAARSSSDFDVLAEPMMLVVDGGEAKIRDGEKIPIPQKTVFETGTVTTVGYEYIDTGILVSSSIREMTQSTASCTLSIDITQINGYVEGAPITIGQSFSTTTVLESGGTYLIGSMSKSATTKDKSGAIVNTFFGNKYSDGVIMIWLRCYRINGPYKAILN